MDMFAGGSFRGRSRQARWRCYRLRSVCRALSSLNRAIRLYQIMRWNPCQGERDDAVAWAQDCLDQAERLIGRSRDRGVINPGDLLAIEAYGAGLAVGFYRP